MRGFWIVWRKCFLEWSFMCRKWHVTREERILTVGRAELVSPSICWYLWWWRLWPVRAWLCCGHLSIHFPSFHCLAHQPPNGSRQLSCNQDGSLAGIEHRDKTLLSCHHLNGFCLCRRLREMFSSRPKLTVIQERLFIRQLCARTWLEWQIKQL